MPNYWNREHIFEEIGETASRLEVPRAEEKRAYEIYQRAKWEGLLRGRSREEIVPAALYAATREREFPLTLDEIAEVSPVGKKRIYRNYCSIRDGLDIHSPPPDPISYVPRITSKLDYPEEKRPEEEPIPEKTEKAVEEEAQDILERAKEVRGTAGKSPSASAAGAVYLSGILTGNRKTQKEVAEASNVAEVTVRNRYKEMVKKLNWDERV